MRLRLLRYLICPLDGGSLELHEWDSAPVTLTPDALTRIRRLGADVDDFAREVTSGVLVNARRKVFYPIEFGVPRMLVFPTAATRQFAQEHAERLRRELPGFTLPNGSSMPGEETVLRTFSSEWVNYEWKGDAVLERLTSGALPEHEVPAESGGESDSRPAGPGGRHRYRRHCRLHGRKRKNASSSASTWAMPPTRRNRRSVARTRSSTSCSLPRLRFRSRTRRSIWSTARASCIIRTTPGWHSNASARYRNTVDGSISGSTVPTSEQRTPLRRMLMGIENAVRPLVWSLPEALQTLALIPVIPVYMLHQNFSWRGISRLGQVRVV